jgi:hypothetical protein
VFCASAGALKSAIAVTEVLTRAMARKGALTAPSALELLDDFIANSLETRP